MPNGRTKTKYSEWSGDDLRKQRAVIGMTQTAMAEHLGMSHRMYCYYESGKTPVNRPLQLAVQYMVESPQREEEKPQGTLTDFQRERINMLLDAIEKYPTSDLDETGQKILQQSVSEISMLMEHLSKS
jgi:transcriptional regulator with XRE-family HTH domain